jgi:hypothetical protein
MNTNNQNVTVLQSEQGARLSSARTATMVPIAVVFALSMLLTGCEYAMPLHISRNVRKMQATLNPETASAILQKYLAANAEHSGVIGFDYQSDGNEWLWMARGAPTLVTVADGIVKFEAGADKEFKKLKEPGQSINLLYKDATPSWFVNSKFEISLATVRGVVFWDPVHSPRNVPHEIQVDLQWSDPEEIGTRRPFPPGTRSGKLSLYLHKENNDEFIAALRYFAPGATFTAAR